MPPPLPRGTVPPGWQPLHWGNMGLKYNANSLLRPNRKEKKKCSHCILLSQWTHEWPPHGNSARDQFSTEQMQSKSSCCVSNATWHSPASRAAPPPPRTSLPSMCCGSGGIICCRYLEKSSFQHNLGEGIRNCPLIFLGTRSLAYFPVS